MLSFSNYTPISMETTQRKLNMCDMDVGVHIDMVDPATYKISEEPVQVCIFCFIKTLYTSPKK